MDTTTSVERIGTADGTMSAFLARPTAAGPHPAVLVIMEAFGLNRHIQGVATRIAAAGFVALAPDMYYREPNAVVAYDQLPDAIRLMSGLRDDSIVADVRAAVAHLQSLACVRGDRIGITGFCMGGRISFLSACAIPEIKASAPFYGGGIGGLLDRAPTITCPLLFFFGDQDAFIPNDEVTKITETLRDLKKAAEVQIYPGAPHGFFCDERDSYRAAAAGDAWRRLTTFLALHLRS